MPTLMQAAVIPVFAAENNTQGAKKQAAKKTLVIYYSATGTTERLAKLIAQETALKSLPKPETGLQASVSRAASANRP